MKNIYKKIFLLILNSTFSIYNSFSQTAPAIEWQNTIGGSNADALYSLQQTNDGGYILGGLSMSNISGDKTENCFGTHDYWIVKVDDSGTVQWDKTIGGSDFDWITSIQQTFDSGYILGGSSESDISGNKTENNCGTTFNYPDYWIVKTDSTGNIQWQNNIGGSSVDYLESIRQTAYGGYIFGGSSISQMSCDKTENSNGGYDYWIIKTDASGNIQWQNSIGGNQEDLCNSMQLTTDGGYILGGTSYSNISADKTENCNGDSDYWIVKLDSSGNIQWQNTIGGNKYDELYSLQQVDDGGYILGGYSESNISGDKMENCIGGIGFGDFWIVKTDSVGNTQWQNTIGGSDLDELHSIQQTSDGGYIIGGFSLSNISGDKTENSNGGNDYWIVKLDSSGNIQWQNTIGGNSLDQFSSLQQASDGGYILGGTSYSNISGDKTENNIGNGDFWILKLFPDTITGISNLQSSTYNIQFSPNPLITQSTLTFSNSQKNIFHFTLYDITGRVTETVSTVTDKIILTKGSKPAGVYLFNLTNAKTGEGMNGKIVISAL
ncbi:MAG: T9SS type A sorting domain-containing protein [Bacteroidia bacterium]